MCLDAETRDWDCIRAINSYYLLQGVCFAVVFLCVSKITKKIVDDFVYEFFWELGWLIGSGSPSQSLPRRRFAISKMTRGKRTVLTITHLNLSLVLISTGTFCDGGILRWRAVTVSVAQTIRFWHWSGSRIFLRNFCHCGTEEIVKMLLNQLPWRRFVVSKCF